VDVWRSEWHTLQGDVGRLGRAHLKREGPTTFLKASFHFLLERGRKSPWGRELSSGCVSEGVCKGRERG
jgi:hypothetical protein